MTEKDVAILSKELEYMNKSIQELQEMLKSHMVKEEMQMERLLENLDKKYSGKWVEKVIWGAAASIWLSLLWAILVLILK